MADSNTKTNQSLLGFDYGTRQIGVALLQTQLDFATPLCVLRSKKNKPDWHAIETLCKEWQPSKCIVGLALNMDGSDSELGDRCKRFSRQLDGRFGSSYGFTVELQDERLSSVEAKELIRDLQAEANYLKTPADSLAAKIILERWLASHST